MRAGAGVQLIALELAADGIEDGDVVAALTDEPHRVLVVSIRIARSGVLPWHRPFGDLDLADLSDCHLGGPDHDQR